MGKRDFARELFGREIREIKKRASNETRFE